MSLSRAALDWLEEHAPDWLREEVDRWSDDEVRRMRGLRHENVLLLDRLRAEGVVVERGVVLDASPPEPPEAPTAEDILS